MQCSPRCVSPVPDDYFSREKSVLPSVLSFLIPFLAVILNQVFVVSPTHSVEFSWEGSALFFDNMGEWLGEDQKYWLYSFFPASFLTADVHTMNRGMFPTNS